MSSTYLLIMLIAVVALATPSVADFPKRPGYGHIPPAHSPKSGPEHEPPTHFGEPPIDHRHPHHKHPEEDKPFGPGPVIPPHFPAHPPIGSHSGHFPANPPKEGHDGHFPAHPPRRTRPPQFIAPSPY